MLQALLLTYPQLDPIALSLGPLVIRWYALAYIAGIVGGWYYIKWLNKDPRIAPALTKTAWDDMVTWAVLSILLGGRLGYILFYQPAYYFAHPLEMFKVWEGGMSFHGGLAGMLIGYAIFARKYKLRYLEVMDLLACAAPIGLCLGRLANFVNGELYGRVAQAGEFGAALAMVFPHGGPEPRHPSQLYEAALEGVALFILLFLVAKLTTARRREGLIGGLFLAGYAVARMTAEHFREPDVQYGYLWEGLTMGQLLSLPVLIAGLLLIVRAFRRAPRLP